MHTLLFGACHTTAATLRLCTCCGTAQQTTAVAVALHRMGEAPASRGVGHLGALRQVEDRRGWALQGGSQEDCKHLHMTPNRLSGQY